MAYDAANQTEYFRTLQVYSLTLHNKESTARILCIHRNTLLYRLGKISELFHVPYEDQQTALALLNSFQLYGVSTLSRADFGWKHIPQLRKAGKRMLRCECIPIEE